MTHLEKSLLFTTNAEPCQKPFMHVSANFVCLYLLVCPHFKRTMSNCNSKLVEFNDLILYYLYTYIDFFGIEKQCSRLSWLRKIINLKCTEICCLLAYFSKNMKHALSCQNGTKITIINNSVWLK